MAGAMVKNVFEKTNSNNPLDRGVGIGGLPRMGEVWQVNAEYQSAWTRHRYWGAMACLRFHFTP